MDYFSQFSPAGAMRNRSILAAAAAAVIPSTGTVTTKPDVGTTYDSANNCKDKGGKGMGDGGAGTTLDSALDTFADQHFAAMAVAVVNEWAQTDDLDAGESQADRLVNMLIGAADENIDGELSDDEKAVATEIMSAGVAYMVNLGVSEEDAENALAEGEVGAETAARVREFVASKLPEGEDAEGALLDSVVFTDEDQEPVLDSAYKKKVAIRGGRKVIINKRISGTVRLSPKQKLALKKARRKATGAQAMARRAKSMRMRQSMGMNR